MLTSTAKAASPETGKDNRTDGVSVSFQSALQYSNLFTGSASFTIPIDLPPGPGGFSPELALTYSSNAVNGWVGLGWEIAGLHHIERSTRFGVPSYSDCPKEAGPCDRFLLVLQGQQYELFWDPTQGKYVTNPHANFAISYSRTYECVDRWTLVDASGVEYTFPGIPAAGRAGYRYYPVERVRDPNGNLIRYEYVIDSNQGAYYPSSITYGFSDATTVFQFAKTIRVEFILEKRQIECHAPGCIPGPQTYEVRTDYLGGSRMIQDRRVRRITVSSQGAGTRPATAPTGVPYTPIPPGRIRSYELKYAASLRGHQSLLESVTQATLSGDLAYRFTYDGQDRATEGFKKQPPGAVQNLWPLKSARGGYNTLGERFPGVRWVDINGDALADMVWGLDTRGQRWPGARVGGKALASKPFQWAPIESALQSYSGPLSSVTADYTGFPAPIDRLTGTYGSFFTGTEIVDVNNDGFVDIVYAFDDSAAGGGFSHFETWINDRGKGWVLDPRWRLPAPLASYVSGGASKIADVKIVDVNGDGFPDLVDAKNGTYINLGGSGGTGWAPFADPLWKAPVNSFGYFGVVHDATEPARYVDLGVRYLDLNGDGLADVIMYRDPGCKTLPVSPNVSRLSCEYAIDRAWINTGHKQANGSAYLEQPQWRVPALAFKLGTFQLGANMNGSNLGTQTVDINGDGLPDILYSLSYEGFSSKAVLFNTGNGWSYPLTPGLIAAADPNKWVSELPDFAVKGYHWNAFGQISGERWFQDNGVSMADFDGDGAIDIGQSVRHYYNHPNGQDDVWLPEDETQAIYLNQFKKALLKKAMLPYGGSVEFEYASSHAGGADHRDAAGVHRLPSPMQVVRAITVDNGVKQAVRTEFSYRGGLFDFEARESRGFRQVTVTPGGAAAAIPGAETVFTFFQNDARRGQIAAIRRGGKTVLQEAVNSYVTVSHGSDGISKSWECLHARTTEMVYESVQAGDLIIDLNFDAPGRLGQDTWNDAATLPAAVSSGIVWTAQSVSGLSAYFADKTAFVRLGASGIAFPSVTYQAWIWPERVDPKRLMILVEKESAFSVVLDENFRLYANVYDGRVWRALRSDHQIPTNQFSHVAFTYDGAGRGELYVNGRRVAETGDLPRPPAGGDLFIAHWPHGDQFSFRGYMDEVKLFRRVVNVPAISEVSFGYDQYGNRSYVFARGDIADARDDFVLATHFEPLLAAHILNLPRRQSLSAKDDPPATAVKRAAWFEYDARGNLLRDIRWGGERDSSGSPLEKGKRNPIIALKYDSWGNIIEVTDPLGRKSTVDYDPAYPAFATAVKNPLGQITSLEHYGISPDEQDWDRYLGLFGQIKRVGLPSGATTRLVYDMLGRIRAEYGPRNGDIARGSLYPSTVYSYAMESVGAGPQAGPELLRINISKRADFPDPAMATLSTWAFGDRVKSDGQRALNTASGLFMDNYLQSGETRNHAVYLDGLGRVLQSIGEGGASDTAIVSGGFDIDALGRISAIYRPQPVVKPSMFAPFGSYRHLKLEPLFAAPAKNTSPARIDYDGAGRQLRFLNPDGNLTTFAYRPRRTTVVDPRGHKREYHFDAFGRVVQVDEHSGEYGEPGQGDMPVVAPTPKPGVADTPADERLVEKGPSNVRVARVRPPIVLSTRYTYDVAGDLLRITDPAGNETIFEYDSLGRPTAVKDPDQGGLKGKSWSFGYDLAGNLIESVNPANERVEHDFDDLDRPVRRSYCDRIPSVAETIRFGAPLEAPPQATGLWHLTSHRSATAPYSFAFNREADHTYASGGPAIGALTIGPLSLTEFTGNRLSFAYYWDVRSPSVMPVDQMSVWASSDGNSWELLLSHGELVSHHPAKTWGTMELLDVSGWDRGKLWLRFVFDTVAASAGTTREGWYIDDVKVEGFKRRDLAAPVVWTYDDPAVGGPWAAGQLVRMEDASGVTMYRYDRGGEMSQLRKTIKGVTYTTGFEYDALGRLRALVYPDKEKVIYSYSRDGQLVSVKSADGTYLENAVYDEVGNPRQLTFGNGVKTKIEYNDNLTGVARIKTGLFPEFFKKTGSPPEVLYHHSTYQYDRSGNVSTRTDELSPYGPVLYAYDFVDRLVRTSGDEIVQYGFEDALANIRRKGEYEHEHQKTGWAGPHAVTAAVRVGAGSPAMQFEYDAAGRLINMKSANGTAHHYTYDFDSRLTGIDRDHKYIYDGDGARVWKLEGKATTISPSPVADVLNGKLIKYYVGAGQILARRGPTAGVASKVLYHHTDRLGSVVLVTDDNGKVVASASYGDYGEQSGTAQSALGRYRFTGQEIDASGLYFFGARYYDPAIGRFLTPDPLLQLGPGQQRNPYAYARFNPGRFVDPLGLKEDARDSEQEPDWGIEVHLTPRPAPERSDRLDRDPGLAPSERGSRGFIQSRQFLAQELPRRYVTDVRDPNAPLDPGYYWVFPPEEIRGSFRKAYQVEVVIVQPSSGLEHWTGHAALVIENLRTGKQVALSWGGTHTTPSLISRYAFDNRRVLVYTYDFSEAEGRAVERRAEWLRDNSGGGCRWCTRDVREALTAAESYKRAEPWYYPSLLRVGPEGFGRMLDIMHATGRFKYLSRRFW